MHGEERSGGPLLLAIDVGTQSVRALLFDAAGRRVAAASEAMTPCFTSQPGWAEQDCSYYWERLGAACRALWSAHPGLRDRVVAAGLTTQRATVVCLDARGEPLRPAIVWLDRRRTRKHPPRPRWLRAAGPLAGGALLDEFQRRAQCNWLAAHEPGVWAETRHYLLLSGYLTWRLTGRMVDAVPAQVGYLPFDFRRQRWAAPGNLRWRLLRVRREQLPELVPAGGLLGRVSAAAAEATGIPAGLPLHAAGADKACQVLGTGASGPDVACLDYGTTATVNTAGARYVEAYRFAPAYPAARPDHWTTEVMVQRGYWLVRWFKREFAAAETALARERGVAPETLFEDFLRETPPGALGLMLQPFWNPGVPWPGAEARGAIVGFGDVHTRAHVYRAIVEGIGHALRAGLARLERRNRVRVRLLRVSGGGAASDAIMQTTADLFGLPAERAHVTETSALGAAINAAVGAGLHADHAAAVAAMTRPGARFLPRPEIAARYAALHRAVYRPLYGRLAPLYRRMHALTGYPPR